MFKLKPFCGFKKSNKLDLPLFLLFIYVISEQSFYVLMNQLKKNHYFKRFIHLVKNQNIHFELCLAEVRSKIEASCL